MIWAPSSHLLLALFACVGISVGAPWLLQGLHHFVTTDWTDAWRFDAAIDHVAARLFWQGISPYSAEGLRLVGVGAFGHPPTTPFWFLPLAAFDHAAMAQAVGLFNFAMLLALVAIAVFTLRFPLPFVTTLLIVGYAQNSPPTFDHNKLVQLSVAIAFGMVLSWKYLRDGKDFRGGAVLGLICTLKPFPAVIVLLLLFMARFRAVAAAAASFLAVAAIMASRWGLEAWRLFFEQQDGVARAWVDTVRNASLQGVVRRLLRDRCGPAVLDEANLRWLTLGACLTLLGFCTWLALRAARRRLDRATFDRVFALFCVLAPFINPWVWEHYVFMLILPVLVAVRGFAEHFLESFQHWVNGIRWQRRHPVGMLVSALALLPLAAIPSWTHVTFYVNSRATEHYCSFSGSPEIKSWLLRRAQYFDLTNWLPWAVTLGVLALLLVVRQPRASV